MCVGRRGTVVRASQASPGAVPAGRVPVLVELFTSEGCSSCPPADALLGELDRRQPLEGAEIIVLSEHVDYWDQGGWHDRFSSAQMTERQKAYGDFFKLDDVYTPQMVVNGAAQMNGTDARAVATALEQAKASQPLALEITNVAVQGSSVRFALRNGPEMPGTFDVYAALVDPEDTTEVGGGENRGRRLEHVGVVRKLALVGSAWRTRELGKMPFVVQAPGRTTPNGMRLVVFVQTKQIGPVRGAGACLITNAKTDSGTFGACPV
jgi:hypothetical protein